MSPHLVSRNIRSTVDSVVRISRMPYRGCHFSCQRPWKLLPLWRLGYVPSLLSQRYNLTPRQTLNAIENSNTTSAWTFVSAAASMCQTMKYHCSRSSTEDGSDSQTAQRRLFWAIYRFDKSLSLRLGRSSTIRDSDITLPLSPVEPRPSTLARIQGKTYEELYSPVGLSRQGDDRGYCAAALAVQVRKLIDETYFDLSVSAFYLYWELCSLIGVPRRRILSLANLKRIRCRSSICNLTWFANLRYSPKFSGPFLIPTVTYTEPPMNVLQSLAKP